MRKKFIIIFTIFAALAALAAAGVWYQKNHQAPLAAKPLPNIDRHLTPDQQKIYTGRILKAEEYLKSLDQSKPNYKFQQSGTYVNLGQQYYGLGQLQKSKDYYDLALKAVPTNEDALVGLAVTLLEAGDSPGAAKFLKQALDQNPNNPDLWLRYIGVKKSMGATSAELNDLYNQALKATGRYVDVLTNDADFQETTGNLAQAIMLWEEAAKSYPQNSAVYLQEAARLKADLAKSRK